MKNIHKIAQKFKNYLKLADENLETLFYLAPESEPRQFSSKKTPTEFLDRDKNFIAPLVRNFRLDLTEITSEVKALLQNALVAQTQINNFVGSLEVVDESLAQINRNLIIAQKNQKERKKLVLESQNLFANLLPTIKKAKSLSDFSLIVRLLTELSKEISVLDNSEQAIQKAQQKLQTLTEMS